MFGFVKGLLGQSSSTQVTGHQEERTSLLDTIGLSSPSQPHFQLAHESEPSDTNEHPPTPPTSTRRSRLTWFSKSAPPETYVRIKGEAELGGKGYEMQCEIFADVTDPPDNIGQISDIFVNSNTHKLYARVEGSNKEAVWQEWAATSQHLCHPLAPEFRLIAQTTQGVKWGTRNAYYLVKSRQGTPQTISDCVKVTTSYHKTLSAAGAAKKRRAKRKTRKIESGSEGEGRSKWGETRTDREPKQKGEEEEESPRPRKIRRKAQYSDDEEVERRLQPEEVMQESEGGEELGSVYNLDDDLPSENVWYDPPSPWFQPEAQIGEEEEEEEEEGEEGEKGKREKEKVKKIRGPEVEKKVVRMNQGHEGAEERQRRRQPKRKGWDSDEEAAIDLEGEKRNRVKKSKKTQGFEWADVTRRKNAEESGASSTSNIFPIQFEGLDEETQENRSESEGKKEKKKKKKIRGPKEVEERLKPKKARGNWEPEEEEEEERNKVKEARMTQEPEEAEEGEKQRKPKRKAWDSDGEEVAIEAEEGRRNMVKKARRTQEFEWEGEGEEIDSRSSSGNELALRNGEIDPVQFQPAHETWRNRVEGSVASSTSNDIFPIQFEGLGEEAQEKQSESDVIIGKPNDIGSLQADGERGIPISQKVPSKWFSKAEVQTAIPPIPVPGPSSLGIEEAALPPTSGPSSIIQRLRINPEAWLKRAGIEWPSSAKTIAWVSGVFTVLPWMKVRGGINPDVKAVEHMAQAPDVTFPDDIRSLPGDPRVDTFKQDPMVVVMEWNDELRGPQSSGDASLYGYTAEEISSHKKLCGSWYEEVENHLAAGRYVIIRGWKPDSKTAWDEDSISLFKGPIDQTIEYQDATVRASSYNLKTEKPFHKVSTLSDFIRAGTNDPENSGNCLDSPGLRAETPAPILKLAHCTGSLELTRGQNDARLPLCADIEAVNRLPAWRKEKRRGEKKDEGDKCGRCHDIKAMVTSEARVEGKALDNDWSIYEEGLPTTNAKHRQEENVASGVPRVTEDDLKRNQKTAWSWIGHIFQVFSTFGPFTASWDAWKSCIWDLFTHAGFFTYVHHDGAGYCTYIWVREGCKIWGILRPKITSTHTSRASVYDLMRRIIKPQGMLDYMQYADVFTIFVMVGDLVIQPANAIHQVFTPVNTISSGGHFLNWATLHLTEWAMRYDHAYFNFSTNADHEGVQRYLYRMAMSLPLCYKSRKFLRRPILALAAMVLKPERYQPHASHTASRARLSACDLTRLETDADRKRAVNIIQTILAFHQISEEQLEAELDVGGVDWAKAGDRGIDLSCLAMM